MTSENFWRGKSVLVAGATGFIGGWIVARLVDLGANVVALVRTRREQSQFFMTGLDRRVAVEYASIEDHAAVQDVFTRHNVEIFFHAAFGSDVNSVLKDPLACFRATTESTWQILDFLRRTNNKCVSVISSTDKVYGEQAVLPCSEDALLNPVHPHSVARASQDLAAQCFGKIYGLPVATTRCGNYFGPFDFNFSHIIPGTLKSLAHGAAPVLRSDGRFTRDFLYIEDAVDVQLMLAERLATDSALAGEAFNFSYGEQIEIIDIVKRVTKLAGRDVAPIVDYNVQAEIRYMQLSSDKARRLLGWRPQVGFDAGLVRTVSWYEQHFAAALAAA